MSAGLGKSDRRLLLISGSLFIVLVAAGALGEPEAQEPAVAPSIYSSASGGARGAYLLLSELRYPVRIWEEPPEELPDATGGKPAVLILADPKQPPTESEVKAVKAFVENGGRVLVCGGLAAAFFSDIAIAPAEDGEDRAFAAAMPSRITHGAPRIQMKSAWYWDISEGSQTILYGDEKAGAVVSWPLGKGQVIWWASASPLTNGAIRQESNLQLFLNSIEGGPIFWDEYFHGRRSGLFANAGGTPVAWGALQLGIALLLVLFTFARRRGPVVAPRVESRLSPLEFVNTIGGLYRRSRAAAIPVETSYRNLRTHLVRRLGVPVSTTDAELAKQAGERLHIDAAEVRNSMAQAVPVKHDLRARDALKLVRRLEELRKAIKGDMWRT